MAPWNHPRAVILIQRAIDLIEVVDIKENRVPHFEWKSDDIVTPVAMPLRAPRQILRFEQNAKYVPIPVPGPVRPQSGILILRLLEKSQATSDRSHSLVAIRNFQIRYTSCPDTVSLSALDSMQSPHRADFSVTHR